VRRPRGGEAAAAIAALSVPVRSLSAQVGGAGTDWTLVLAVLGIIGTLLVMAGVGLVRWMRGRTFTFDDPAPPLITIPHSPVHKPMAPSMPRRQTPATESLPVVAPQHTPPVPVHHASPRGGNGTATDGELVEGNTIRFYRPPDGTLQLLPGRLEIVAGEELPHDIRFIRARGEEPEVTFGRSDGPPHRHVQLHARTVSRQHARMRFAERHWFIENLSDTNPVVVNGEELDSGDGGHELKEGDRIEMGEVVFRFRER
jgi:hypothetical protein